MRYRDVVIPFGPNSGRVNLGCIELHPHPVRSGNLRCNQDGRRIYYTAETASPLYQELRGIFSKTAGIIPSLRSELARFRAKIKWAAIYGSVAKGEEQADSDIDLLIVGSIGMTELAPSLQLLA